MIEILIECSECGGCYNITPMILESWNKIEDGFFCNECFKKVEEDKDRHFITTVKFNEFKKHYNEFLNYAEVYCSGPLYLTLKRELMKVLENVMVVTDPMEREYKDRTSASMKGDN